VTAEAEETPERTQLPSESYYCRPDSYTAHLWALQPLYFSIMDIVLSSHYSVQHFISYQHHVDVMQIALQEIL
jgi:hypothetical protein